MLKRIESGFEFGSGRKGKSKKVEVGLFSFEWSNWEDTRTDTRRNRWGRTI